MSIFTPEIGQFLEELSAELIISDPNDSAMLSNFTKILNSIQTLLKKNNPAPIDKNLSRIETLIRKIVTPNFDHKIDKYHTIISDIEKIVVEINTIADEKTCLNSFNHLAKPENKTINYHPGNLPAYLNAEDFFEFLSHQTAVLNEFETLILEFEKGHLDSPAKNIKRILHTMKGESGFLSLEDVEKVCHKTEDLLSQTLHPDASEILFQVKDWLSEIFLVYSGGFGKPEKCESILDKIEHYETLNTERTNNEVNADIDVSENLSMEKNIRGESNISASKSINIKIERLDKLIDIIGELAIAEAMVTQNHEIANIRSQEYFNSLRVLSNITKELQDVGLTLRMIPLKTLFNRMARVARDVSKKSNKRVDFTLAGQGTELDKNLVDGLGDPLIHMIRNSIDHGIESDPQERINLGKPEVATIKINAYRKGENLHIEIIDDGRGINQKQLVKKAIAAGHLDDVSQLDDHKINNLIFLSGISTAEKVTELSGRGVGMDVVQDRISSLNGKIEVESKQGVGTKMLIKLPLTLAIMDGMVVRIGNSQYILPTLSVVTSLKPKEEMVTNVFQKREFIKVHEELIPIFRINRFFDIPDSLDKICDGIVVIVEEFGAKAAVFVDELISKQNVVRKNLGHAMQDITGVSGGTIMSDGKVCLILDPGDIITMAHTFMDH